ncbi:MAG: hypothetical protein QM786_18835 [Breznakibacter sp.]
MKTITNILILIILFPFCIKSQSNCFVNDSIQTYLQFLKRNEKSPEEYTAKKFRQHDIVIVGEVHQKKEYCELISKIIESSDINYFATEFIKSSNSDKINQIVTAKEFDREKAVDIFRDYTWPIWGFEEYVNIIQSVWKVNSSKKPKDHVKIIGLDSEWSQFENMCANRKPADDILKQNMEREDNMVKAVKEKYSKGTKILVHIGFAHTLYKLKPRFAAELYSEFGDKVFQICLHQQFEGNLAKMTISKDIEKIMEANNNVPVGFDVENSPFAKINDASCYYFKVPQQQSLKDIAMGYIFIKPFPQLGIVTWVPGFINEYNFEKAKCVSLKMGFIKSEPQTIKEFNESMSLYFNGKEAGENHNKLPRR